ncbi:uncharacterized protein B0I36DRAFT_359930 [Microdochium trichocladiopsis]|uniref:Uncharacterized protein n=1 Tax=Microdochium trichocladiopsis TaxID=1682393 RepID=A0A9P9BVB5_9PEZI|nr:uncharacterized protein B0I36DRAFT_359930 [Microdochium trichocladiopsis]KAH7038354.1 hypothetical protein B0I36DRAFT_359930 [Microdochium trichocladiopsis]
MYFKSLITVAFTALMAGQALGIATDPYYACNCPNNCSHDVNSSCKYYANHSNSGPVVSGRCRNQGDGMLVCEQQ